MDRGGRLFDCGWVLLGFPPESRPEQNLAGVCSLLRCATNTALSHAPISLLTDIFEKEIASPLQSLADAPHQSLACTPHQYTGSSS